MGGRGSYAAGNNVEYTYKTVGLVDGVKILQGIGNKHGLPESSHSSEAYIKLKPDGTFHEMRFYNKEHVLYMEIAYHPEQALTGNRHTPILHYHCMMINLVKIQRDLFIEQRRKFCLRK